MIKLSRNIHTTGVHHNLLHFVKPRLGSKYSLVLTLLKSNIHNTNVLRSPHLQVDSLKKGYDGFDKDGGTINQTSMMMILKSMGVEVNKSDMDNYASEVDEEETGKFTFMMFCQVNI